MIFVLLTTVFRQGDTNPTDGHALAFTPGDRPSRLAQRISPKGTEVELQPAAIEGIKGRDHLAGRIALGVKELRGDGQVIVLGRTEADALHDLLLIDTDLDGVLTDEKPITTAVLSAIETTRSCEG
jgi:hypothetical protein